MENLEHDEAVVNVIEYLLAIHNTLRNIVVGANEADGKLLIIPEEQYLRVLDSLSNVASELAKSIGLTVEREGDNE